MTISRKSKVWTFQDPIYESSYEVLFSTDLDEASSFLDEIIIHSEARMRCDGIAFKLWFGRDDIRALAHEAQHCVDRVFEWVNSIEDDQCREPRAYYMGWLMEQLQSYAEKACQPTKARKTTTRRKAK